MAKKFHIVIFLSASYKGIFGRSPEKGGWCKLVFVVPNVTCVKFAAEFEVDTGGVESCNPGLLNGTGDAVALLNILTVMSLSLWYFGLALLLFHC